MPVCQRLIALGDLALTLPTAAALLAALLTARAWRMAGCWGMLFALATALVGASKIVFLGWGGGWPQACFKAFSGHATTVTAIAPMLFYLTLYRFGRLARAAGLLAGLGLGAAVAVPLVVLHEHSLAEAAAGWCLGALVTPLAIGLAGPFAVRRHGSAAGAFVLTLAAGMWMMQWAPVGYWMIVAARLLSGNKHVFSLGLS